MSKEPLHSEDNLQPGNEKTDQVVFDELFHRYYNRIYGKALQVCKVQAVAQDIAQHVFLKLWEKRTEFATLPNIEAWLFNVANHQIVDVFRRQVRQEKYRQFAIELLEQEMSSPEEILITRQQKQLLEKGLETLSPRQQQVYRLNRQEGMSYAEIADQLELSRETVKEYLMIAIAKIRSFIKEHRTEWLLIYSIVQIFFR